MAADVETNQRLAKSETVEHSSVYCLINSKTTEINVARNEMKTVPDVFVVRV